MMSTVRLSTRSVVIYIISKQSYFFALDVLASPPSTQVYLAAAGIIGFRVSRCIFFRLWRPPRSRLSCSSRTRLGIANSSDSSPIISFLLVDSILSGVASKRDPPSPPCERGTVAFRNDLPLIQQSLLCSFADRPLIDWFPMCIYSKAHATRQWPNLRTSSTGAPSGSKDVSPPDRTACTGGRSGPM